MKNKAVRILTSKTFINIIIIILLLVNAYLFLQKKSMQSFCLEHVKCYNSYNEGMIKAWCDGNVTIFYDNNSLCNIPQDLNNSKE